MNLVLDIGNSKVKAAVFEKNTLLEKKTVSLGDLGNLIDHFFSNFSFQQCIISSVSVSSQEIDALMPKEVKWLMFDSSIKLPIINNYKTPETLGSDRLAGLMGAFELKEEQENTLVIDMGSCITYDLLTNDHHYFGGAISPGIQMRYKALQQQTKRLPLLEPEQKPNLIGTSTQESMHSGVVNGVKYEMQGVINAYKERFGFLTVIVTGGDAIYFAAESKNTIFADQDLILKGLNNILNYHYQNN